MTRVFLPLLFFAFLPVSFASGSSAAICTTAAQSAVRDLDQLSNIAKNALASDIGKFCNDTAWGALEYSSVPRPMKEAKDLEKLKELASKMNTNRTLSYNGPWSDSLVPNMNFRGNLFMKYCKRHPYCAPIDEMREYIREEKEIPYSVRRATVYASFDEGKQSPKFNQAQAGQGYVKAIACAGVSVLNSLECAKGLDKIIEYATPIVGYESSSVTAVPSYKKVLNKKYLAGAKRAALLILDRFEQNQVQPGANVFDDIYNSYRKEGMSHEEADDITWEIMAIIGAGGPNAGPRFVSFKSDPELESLKWSISAIAIAIPKLDLMSASSGHPYSMPKEVTTTCDIGKPYHFWMTAYLSRKLVKEGISPKGAASAAYLAQKAYEVKSTTSGRDPNRVFTTPSYGAWNNVLRVDTAFSSAASVFGANRAQGVSRKIDIDAGLKKMIHSGTFLPRLSKPESERLWTEMSGVPAYLRWNKIINADAAFDFHFKNIED